MHACIWLARAPGTNDLSYYYIIREKGPETVIPTNLKWQNYFYTGNHLETHRKSEILNDLFLSILRLIYQEKILLEQDDVPI